MTSQQRTSWPAPLRTRMVLAVLVLVALALLATVVLTRVLLLARVTHEVSQRLHGEVAELRLLAAEGVDPATGQAFVDPRALLTLHLGRSIPGPAETMLVVVDGEVVARSDDVPPTRLDRDPEFVRTVSGAMNVEYGTYETSAGEVRYAAVPVTVTGSQSRGTYVLAVFVDRDAAFIGEVTRALLIVSVIVLVLCGVAAWILVGRALAPVRAMQQTARSINEANLRGRMVPRHPPGSRSWDELDDLSDTVNAMLDRLEVAFAGQRQFLDDAGHELRTPLTVVRGHLELLADDPDTVEETVELVSDELDRMARLVADLQTLTSATQLDFVHPVPVALDGLVREVLAKAATLADRAWVLDAAEPATAMLDRHRTTQALLELATNAVRWTGPGDEIGLGADVSEGLVRLWVRDTGPGVDPEVAERLFERFVHGSSSSGSGLGLSIVAAITHAQGGTAEVRSEKPHGARFVLTFPALGSGGGEQE